MSRPSILFAGLVFGLALAGCNTPTEVKPEQPTMAEFGICYDARGCPSGQESAFSVEKGNCQASGGKSWKGAASGCVNF